MKKAPLRIGIAGLGTVGARVYSLLAQHPFFQVTAVSARDKSRDRGIDLSAVDWVDDPLDLTKRDDVDVVVELMGGSEGAALSLVKSALQNKKPVVTANKALLAYHGVELAHLAEQSSVALKYEAAVAGGIPIIKMIREGLVANRISAIYGILNGTCNYILSKMDATGEDFSIVLAEAQKLGYAEADPSLDVDGGDTGHKLSLLAALAFQGQPDFQSLFVQGIRRVSSDDLMIAKEMGYRIKLVGQALRTENGQILQMVSPSLVPQSSPMAHVDGVLNCILTEGDQVGQSFVAGRGAGAGPTASAVIADLVDLYHGHDCPVFMHPADSLSRQPKLSFPDWRGEFYLRLVVKDQAGVIADIAPVLRDCDISIRSLIQRGGSTAGEAVNIILMTHESAGKDILSALSRISDLPCVLAEPLVMPVLKV